MTSDKPYCVLVIKPLTVSRGEGPLVLKDILSTGKFVISRMMPSNICHNTWIALEDISKDTESAFSFDRGMSGKTTLERVSWVLIIKHTDGVSDPVDELNTLLGHPNPMKWKASNIRYKYSKLIYSAIDDVAFVSPKGKANLTASILIQNFNEEEL